MVHRQRDHKSRACQLYTLPSISTVLPVYTNVNLTWNTACLQIPSNIDLYLSILEPKGLVAVHVWSGVTFGNGGVFSTQLKPSWWNATTGAGSVQAQLAITPTGSPIWNTPAPSGPLFTISYNGS